MTKDDLPALREGFVLTHYLTATLSSPLRS